MEEEKWGEQNSAKMELVKEKGRNKESMEAEEEEKWGEQNSAKLE